MNKSKVANSDEEALSNSALSNAEENINNALQERMNSSGGHTEEVRVMKRITDKLTESFTKGFLNVIATMAYNIEKVGLTFNESCLIVDYDPIDMRAQMELHPILAKFFKIKEIGYKKGLLKTISDKARRGDDKVAMSILTSRFPDTFNSKRNQGETEDMIAEAISLIQDEANPDDIVNKDPDSGTANDSKAKLQALIVTKEDVERMESLRETRETSPDYFEPRETSRETPDSDRETSRETLTERETSIDDIIKPKSSQPKVFYAGEEESGDEGGNTSSQAEESEGAGEETEGSEMETE